MGSRASGVTVTSPPSLVAEEYARLLMQALAQHRRSERAIAVKPAVRGRLAVLPSGFFSRQVRYQATLVRLVTVTEAFTSMGLISGLEGQLPFPASPLVTELYYREENSATAGWQQMSSRYKKSLGGIELKSCDGYPTVMAMVEARNAIVHGLGALTRRQQRDSDLAQLTSKLASIGIVLNAEKRLAVDYPVLKLGAFDSRRFMFSLDAKLRNAGFTI